MPLLLAVLLVPHALPRSGFLGPELPAPELPAPELSATTPRPIPTRLRPYVAEVVAPVKGGSAEDLREVLLSERGTVLAFDERAKRWLRGRGSARQTLASEPGGVEFSAMDVEGDAYGTATRGEARTSVVWRRDGRLVASGLPLESAYVQHRDGAGTWVFRGPGGRPFSAFLPRSGQRQSDDDRFDGDRTFLSPAGDPFLARGFGPSGEAAGAVSAFPPQLPAAGPNSPAAVLGGRLRVLPFPSGFATGDATSVYEGVVVGNVAPSYTLSEPQKSSRPVVWRGGRIEALPTAIAAPEGYRLDSVPQATWRLATGETVGSVALLDARDESHLRPVIWTRGGLRWLSDVCRLPPGTVLMRVEATDARGDLLVWASSRPRGRFVESRCFLLRRR